MTSLLAVWAFIGGYGTFTMENYGPFKTLDECNTVRYQMEKEHSTLLSNFKTKECKRYILTTESKLIWKETNEVVVE